ncbi:MAG: hypothetical protein E7587_09440 [Ruminococcaceae bacterium]|nr:hypothetical protein [Oscillospiraceae bacterium]
MTKNIKIKALTTTFLVALLCICFSLTIAFSMSASDASDTGDTSDFLYGDTNGDGSVLSSDLLMLRKYMAGYDYAANISTVTVSQGADVNGDGKIGVADVLLMRKYMANYDYDTESSSVALGPQTFYVVTFTDSEMFKDEAGDKTVISEVIARKGSAVRAPRDPFHSGYVFIGWDIEDLSSVTSDTLVTAQYRPLDTYILEYYDDTGILLYSAEVREGDAALKPETPLKEGFIFTGWDKDINCVDRTWSDFDAYKSLSNEELAELKLVYKTTALFEAVDGNIPYAENITFQLKEEEKDGNSVYIPVDADKFSEEFAFEELDATKNHSGSAVSSANKYNQVKATTSYAWDGEFIYGYVVVEDPTLLSRGAEYCNSLKDPWQNDMLEYWYSLGIPVSEENQRFAIDFYGHRLSAYDGSDGGYNSMSRFFDEMDYEVKVVEETNTSYIFFKLPAKCETGEALKGGSVIYSAIQLNDIRDLNAVGDSMANIYCSTSNHTDYENGYERYTLGKKQGDTTQPPLTNQTPVTTQPPAAESPEIGEYVNTAMLNEESFTSLNMCIPAEWELFENADGSYSIYRENIEIGQIFKGAYDYKGVNVTRLLYEKIICDGMTVKYSLNKNKLTKANFHVFLFSYENKKSDTEQLTLFLKQDEVSEEALVKLKESSYPEYYEKYTHTGDLLDSSGAHADSVLICGNSFVGSSRISAILQNMCTSGGIDCDITAISRGFARVSTYTSDETVMSDIRNGKYEAVFMCGLYSESELDEIAKLKTACDYSNTRLIIFPAHNEYRVAIEKAKTRFPDVYILDWKAEVDSIIEDGVDFWLMCINDSHKHSTPLAGFVGAHMIYRATFGKEPPLISDISGTITRKEITDNLSEYLSGAPVLKDGFVYYKLK